MIGLFEVARTTIKFIVLQTPRPAPGTSPASDRPPGQVIKRDRSWEDQWGPVMNTFRSCTSFVLLSTYLLLVSSSVLSESSVVVFNLETVSLTVSCRDSHELIQSRHSLNHQDFRVTKRVLGPIIPTSGLILTTISLVGECHISSIWMSHLPPPGI